MLPQSITGSVATVVHQDAKDLKITIPLHKFLDLLWDIRDKCHPGKDLAEIIHLIDANEQLCHVEMDPIENAKGPAVWRIADWKASAERLMRIRAKAEAERQQRFKKEEVRQQLALKISEDSGLAPELAEMLAVQIMTAPDRNKRLASARTFGLDLIALGVEPAEPPSTVRIGD